MVSIVHLFDGLIHSTGKAINCLTIGRVVVPNVFGELPVQHLFQGWDGFLVKSIRHRVSPRLNMARISRLRSKISQGLNGFLRSHPEAHQSCRMLNNPNRNINKLKKVFACDLLFVYYDTLLALIASADGDNNG